jgi:hypothetical protein
MSKVAILILGSLAVSFCGCTIERRPMVEPPTTQNAATGESADNSQAGQMPHVEQFETTLSPPAAIDAVAKLFGELKFDVGADAGGNRWGPYSATSDHFYGSLTAATLEHGTLHVECKWLSESRTRVVFSSDLDDAENAYVVKCIRGVLGTAAAAP